MILIFPYLFLMFECIIAFCLPHWNHTSRRISTTKIQHTLFGATQWVELNQKSSNFNLLNMLIQTIKDFLIIDDFMMQSNKKTVMLLTNKKKQEEKSSDPK